MGPSKGFQQAGNLTPDIYLRFENFKAWKNGHR